jgi:hypothetical protein
MGRGERGSIIPALYLVKGFKVKGDMGSGDATLGDAGISRPSLPTHCRVATVQLTTPYVRLKLAFLSSYFSVCSADPLVLQIFEIASWL